VQQGDEFQINIPKPEPSHLEPKNIPIEVIFEDKDLIVVNKPARLTTHPGAENKTNTIVNALLYHKLVRNSVLELCIVLIKTLPALC
jgi:23S rRNA pseudouridine1911/1915/1917 synthase